MSLKREKETRRPLVAALLLVLALPLTVGCASLAASYHRQIMRGLILSASGGQVHLCIGSRDGAAVGQQLEVYRYQKVPSGMRAGQLLSLRQVVGWVRVLEIVDEHYATATLISGKAEKGFLVALGKKPGR